MKRVRWFLKGSGIGSLVLLFSLLMVGLPISAFGVSLNGASLNLGEGPGVPGSDVRISVTLVTGDLQVAALANDIGFDTKVLELVDLDPNNPQVLNATIGPAGTKAEKQAVSSNPSPGLLRVGVFAITKPQVWNIIQAGVVAYVTFRIKDTAPSGNTVLTNLPSASDPDGNPVSIGGSNGVIHILSTPPAQLNLGTGMGGPCLSATIPITLVTNGWSISATSNDLQYDPSLLKNPRCGIGLAGSEAGKSTACNELEAGLYRVGVVGYNTTPIGNGVVAKVTFDIDCTPVIGTEIPIYNIPEATDPYGKPVPLVGTDGMIKVGGVKITTDSFPPILDANGFAGVFDQQWQLQLEGGTPPYTWSIVGGNLPKNLFLDPSQGVIYGVGECPDECPVPVEFGVFPFTVKVVDNNGFEDRKDLSLKISLLGDGNVDGNVRINEIQIVINSYLGIYKTVGK